MQKQKEAKNLASSSGYEESFHDGWAINEDVLKIDVVKCNESVTAPEMRFIMEALGDLRNKKILDIGSGLGEASVYFAIKGADVTAVDISGVMLERAKRLAEINKVQIKTVKSDVTELNIQIDEKYDLIYLGNIFHHTDIDRTIKILSPHLERDGIMVSWDPLDYNPLIKIYRLLSKELHTRDEHPLKIADLKIFKNYFGSVQTRFFWLTTLVIFIFMAIYEFQSPNKVRYWKKVVEEGEKWKPIYKPLEKLDNIIIKWLPFLRYFCWNVVIISKDPKQPGDYHE